MVNVVLNVVMLDVVMLNVVMPNVVAKLESLKISGQTYLVK
jgi:hypothetical protein